MPTGIGTGIGALFSALGKRKLNDAAMDIYGQRLRSQMAQQAAATALDDSKTSLNNTQLGGMTNYAPALIGAGVAPDKAAILAAAAQANRFANLNTTNQGLGRAFLLGGIGNPQVNNTVAGIDNSKLADGTLYNPTAVPGAQTVQTTPVGMAQINQRNAAAGASAAAAGHSNALTANTGAGAIAARTAAGAKAGLTGDALNRYALTGTWQNTVHPIGAGGVKWGAGVDPNVVARLRGALAAGKDPTAVYNAAINSGHHAEAAALFGNAGPMDTGAPDASGGQ